MECIWQSKYNFQESIFHHRFQGLKWGHQACVASILPAEVSFQFSWLFETGPFTATCNLELADG